MSNAEVREADLLTLHRRHLLAAGVPYERVEAVDVFPTTRTDLRPYYEAVLDGTIPKPAWSKGIKL